MTELGGADEIRHALRLVGERLALQGDSIRIVLIGGAAMNLRGIVTRATVDVDIIALARETAAGTELYRPTEPLPAELVSACLAVARDLGLAHDWMNAGPADLWRHGLPPGLETRLSWERIGGLHFGIVDRLDLIPLKLYAAAHEWWTGPGRHFRDLRALRPTDVEIATARDWVALQDASIAFADLLDQVVKELRHEAR